MCWTSELWKWRSLGESRLRGCLNDCGGTPSLDRKLRSFRVRVSSSRWSPETELSVDSVMRDGV